MCDSTKNSFLKTSPSALVDIKRQGRLRPTAGTSVQSIFAQKWPVIFQKGRHFSGNGFFSKKVFTFYVGLLLQRFPRVSRGCKPSAPPITPPIKRMEAFWCYFSVLVFLLPPRQEIFCQGSWFYLILIGQNSNLIPKFWLWMQKER